jgi:lysozyme
MAVKLPQSGRAKGALAAAAVAGLSLVAFTATNLTMPWEAKRNVAYYDSLGRTWTVCYGETKGVKKGDAYTDRQCMDMLTRRLDADYLTPLRRCVPGFDLAPFSVRAAMLDLSYNVGVQTVCISTAAKELAAQHWLSACDAMTWFNRAGGRVIPGLDLRRKNGDRTRIGEHELCTAGIPG